MRDVKVLNVYLVKEWEEVMGTENVTDVHRVFGVIFAVIFVLSYIVSGIKAIRDRRAIKARMASKSERGITESDSGRLKKMNIQIITNASDLVVLSSHVAKFPESSSPVDNGTPENREKAGAEFAKTSSTLYTVQEQYPPPDTESRRHVTSHEGTLPTSTKHTSGPRPTIARSGSTSSTQDFHSSKHGQSKESLLSKSSYQLSSPVLEPDNFKTVLGTLENIQLSSHSLNKDVEERHCSPSDESANASLYSLCYVSRPFYERS